MLQGNTDASKTPEETCKANQTVNTVLHKGIGARAGQHRQQQSWADSPLADDAAEGDCSTGEVSD